MPPSAVRLPLLPGQARRVGALLLAACIGCAAQAAPQDAPTPVGPNVAGPNAVALDSVWAAEQEWLRAMRRGDTAALRRILSSDHIHVGPGGRQRHKSEMLQALQRGELRFLTYDITSYDIRITGSAAIVSGGYNTQLLRRGVRDVSQGRYLRVWVRDEGGWRLMAHQVTPTVVPRSRS